MTSKKITDFIKESLNNKLFWYWVVLIISISVINYNFSEPIKIRPIYENVLGSNIFSGLALFDASSYLNIAKNGYLNGRLGLAAFFPLFPIIIKILSYPFRLITNENFAIIIAGTIFNLLCFTFSINLLGRIIRLDYEKKIVKISQITLLFFPFSFFFISLYTESLFLLVTLLSFYSARKNKWLLACIFAGIASAVRLPGIILAPALLIEFLYQNKWSFEKSMPRLLWLILAPLGAAIYFIYLQVVRGSVNIYFQAYGASWPDRKFTPLFLESIYKPLIKIFQIRPNDIIGLLSIIFVSFCLYLFYKYKFRPSYVVFSVLGVVLPLITGTMESIGRYYMVIFPLFISLGLFFSSRKKLFILYIVTSVLALLSLATLFVRGIFVG